MSVVINLIKSSIAKTTNIGGIKKSSVFISSEKKNDNINSSSKNSNLVQKALNFKSSSVGSVLTPQTDANAEEKTKQLSKAIVETAAGFLSLIFPKALVVSSINKTSTGSMLIKNIKNATSNSNDLNINNTNSNNTNNQDHYQNQRQMKMN